jgi:hypothetical protein
MENVAMLLSTAGMLNLLQKMTTKQACRTYMYNKVCMFYVTNSSTFCEVCKRKQEEAFALWLSKQSL